MRIAMNTFRPALTNTSTSQPPIEPRFHNICRQAPVVIFQVIDIVPNDYLRSEICSAPEKKMIGRHHE